MSSIQNKASEAIQEWETKNTQSAPGHTDIEQIIKQTLESFHYSQAKESTKTLTEVMASFRRGDLDGDGTLDFGEYEQMVARGRLLQSVPYQTLQAMNLI